ncbi:hypothetical protein Q3C01_29500 [Bradyrhizobium sp. UFLA05-109]
MDISDKITGAESRGDPKAKASTSSATGLGQFINGTWLDMIKRYHPELMDGRSTAEILAMRTDPDLSKEMTAKYAAENEAKLRRAGLPVTPGSAYLMHFAGPGGGIKLMNADPNTPVESILDDAAIKANPFLRGKTASWVMAWADKKMANAAAPKSNVEAQPAPRGGQPTPYLAQTQAVEPAFGATSWPPQPTSPNVLSPDGARPFAAAPRVAPIPLMDGTTRAQQALDNSLPAPGVAPWDLSHRFGAWDTLGGVSGPAMSDGSAGLGQTGDGNGLGTGDQRFARMDADPSLPLEAGRSPAITSGTRSLPAVRFPLEALLAPDRNRVLDQWASSSPRRDVSQPRQGASTGLSGRSAAGIDPSNPDSSPAGGLLGLIQEYMRNNAY